MKREGISTSFHPSLSTGSELVYRSFCVFCVFERCFEKAFHFDFVMIHVGMYTKCSEMFCFEKSF